MSSKDGFRRDLRPNASELFVATLDRALAKVGRYVEAADRAGFDIEKFHSEHASIRGIWLLGVACRRPS